MINAQILCFGYFILVRRRLKSHLYGPFNGPAERASFGLFLFIVITTNIRKWAIS